MGEVHAVLTMSGADREEAYVRPFLSMLLKSAFTDCRSTSRRFCPLQSGKLYLSTSFLTFSSLDRRSCRLTLPLATVRRVEKLASGQEGTAVGAFALALTLFHGLRIVSCLSFACCAF